MDKQFIANAQDDAASAIRGLDEALKMEYCATFKWLVSNAAYLLEQAAKELRAAEEEPISNFYSIYDEE